MRSITVNHSQHHSVVSSDHVLVVLPQGQSPSTIPSITLSCHRTTLLLFYHEVNHRQPFPASHCHVIGPRSCCSTTGSITVNHSQHHSVMSSDHVLVVLPRAQSPSTIPSITLSRHRTTLLLFYHEVNHRQPFPASHCHVIGPLSCCSTTRSITVNHSQHHSLTSSHHVLVVLPLSLSHFSFIKSTTVQRPMTFSSQNLVSSCQTLSLNNCLPFAVNTPTAAVCEDKSTQIVKTTRL